MIPRWQPRDPDWEDKVRRSFARQTVMALIGATLTVVRPGAVEIQLPFRADLCQQHGLFHAGITTTVADSAAGYAAFSLFEPGTMVLTTELKINLLAPAHGDRLRATARVIKPGRTITVAEADVFVRREGVEIHCARMSSSLISRPEA
ncbi:MAG: PaaI family thioesterase [Deltaproteobacteria bacterium]|nr:PaaI family thioesterase [Deltaproteobacteria bacterium]